MVAQVKKQLYQAGTVGHKTTLRKQRQNLPAVRPAGRFYFFRL